MVIAEYNQGILRNKKKPHYYRVLLESIRRVCFQGTTSC